MDEKKEENTEAKKEEPKEANAEDSKKEEKVSHLNKPKDGQKRKSNIVKSDLSPELQEICKKLGETNEHLISLLSEALGVEELTKICDNVLEIEKGEGMLTVDKTRRRTPGGVFLKLAEEKLGTEKFKSLVKENLRERKKQKKSAEPKK